MRLVALTRTSGSDLELPTWFACTWWETLFFSCQVIRLSQITFKVWDICCGVMGSKFFEKENLNRIEQDQKNDNCKLSVAFAGRSELPDKLTSKQANRLALSRVPHCVIIFFILSVTYRHPHLNWNKDSASPSYCHLFLILSLGVVSLAGYFLMILGVDKWKSLTYVTLKGKIFHAFE